MLTGASHDHFTMQVKDDVFRHLSVEIIASLQAGNSAAQIRMILLGEGIDTSNKAIT